jgi:intein-encoded DNA endonuclease-like protein
MLIISNKNKKFIINNYPNKGAKYCADKCNLLESQVRSLVKRLNIKVTKERRSFIAKNKIQKSYTEYNVNPLQFINISTPECAYILGFLWADGFLGSQYSINTEIVSDDAIVIEKIFSSTGKWHIFHRNREGYKPQTKFSCNSKMLYEHLIKLGFKDQNKSPNKILKTIPKKLQHYWFRGYFDGDGCWYYQSKGYLRQCVIASSYVQDWSFIKELCHKLKIKKCSINKTKRINKKGIENAHSRIRFCNIDAIIKFGNYIYNGNQFGLERKLKKFNDIISS